MRDRRKPIRGVGGTPSPHPRDAFATSATPARATRRHPPRMPDPPRELSPIPPRQRERRTQFARWRGRRRRRRARSAAPSSANVGSATTRVVAGSRPAAFIDPSWRLRRRSSSSFARGTPPRGLALRRDPSRPEPPNCRLDLEAARYAAAGHPRLGRPPPQVATDDQGPPPSPSGAGRTQRLSGHDRRPHPRRPRRDDDPRPDAEGVRRSVARAPDFDDGRPQRPSPRPQGQRPPPPRRRVVHPGVGQGSERRRGAAPPAPQRAVHADARSQRVGVRLQGRLPLARATGDRRGRQRRLPLRPRRRRRGPGPRHEAPARRLDRPAATPGTRSFSTRTASSPTSGPRSASRARTESSYYPSG